jgi:hypothetical protein
MAVYYQELVLLDTRLIQTLAYANRDKGHNSTNNYNH